MLRSNCCICKEKQPLRVSTKRRKVDFNYRTTRVRGWTPACQISTMLGNHFSPPNTYYDHCRGQHNHLLAQKHGSHISLFVVLSSFHHWNSLPSFIKTAATRATTETTARTELPHRESHHMYPAHDHVHVLYSLSVFTCASKLDRASHSIGMHNLCSWTSCRQRSLQEQDYE